MKKFSIVALIINSTPMLVWLPLAAAIGCDHTFTNKKNVIEIETELVCFSDSGKPFFQYRAKSINQESNGVFILTESSSFPSATVTVFSNSAPCIMLDGMINNAGTPPAPPANNNPQPPTPASEMGPMPESKEKK
jgi:hypothetical protein